MPNKIDNYLSAVVYIFIWKLYSLITKSLTEYVKTFYKIFTNTSKVHRRKLEAFLEEMGIDIFEFYKKHVQILYASEHYFKFGKEDFRKNLHSEYKNSYSRVALKQKYQAGRSEVYKACSNLVKKLPFIYLEPLIESDTTLNLKLLEADDTIAKYIIDNAEKDLATQYLIFSGDKDLHILAVFKNVNIYNPIKKSFIKPIIFSSAEEEKAFLLDTYAKFLEKYIFGDASDNIKSLFSILNLKPKNKKSVVETCLNNTQIKKENVSAEFYKKWCSNLDLFTKELKESIQGLLDNKYESTIAEELNKRKYLFFPLYCSIPELNYNLTTFNNFFISQEEFDSYLEKNFSIRKTPNLINLGELDL